MSVALVISPEAEVVAVSPVLVQDPVPVLVVVNCLDPCGNRDMAAIEGLLKVKLGPRLKVRLGCDFSRYKYDYNFQLERENVRSFFARTDYKLSEIAGIRLKYSREEDDREHYNVFDVSLVLQW